MIFLHEHIGLALLSSGEGFVLMSSIVAIECFLVRYALARNPGYLVYGIVIGANLVSGLVTRVISNNIRWFPWSFKDDFYVADDFYQHIFHFLSALLLTIGIEFMIGVLFLRKSNSIRSLLIATVLINIISALFGTIMVYFFALTMF